MTEPTNPLFDDEKEFLERKKLEYERALRGDVEVIKEQTIHVGKVALVGAGVASGIWLLAKAFGIGSKSKHKHTKHKKKHKGKYKPAPDSFEDYAGFDGYEDEDDRSQDLDSLANAYNSPEYAYDHADRFADGEDDGFYSEGYADAEGEDDSQVQYEFNTPSRATAYEDDEEDDNGLSNYPDFPAHSSTQHGDDAPASEAGSADPTPAAVYHTDSGYDEDEEDMETTEAPAHSFASAHSYQARPYDDSRRLPESNSFADLDEEPAQPTQATEPAAKDGGVKRMLVPTLMAFAQSETGKVVIAQAAAVAMAFAGKVLKDILPSNEAKAGKNTDLAASSTKPGVEPVAWPATTAAQDVSAAAQHDDALNATLNAREPLA
jgi:hypothetical protein